MNSRQLFLKHIAQTSSAPLGLHIVDSSGVYLTDKNGKKYIDLISGIGPSILGHQHPSIIEAIKSQADKYLHTLVYGEFILDPQTLLADALVKLLPPQLDNIYYLSTGTEATEMAMKLAKKYTGRQEIIASNQSYHGSTNGALSLMSERYFTGPFRPLLPGIRFVEWNNFDHLERITSKTAAVVLETIKAETGINIPAVGYLEAVAQRCKEVGALFILDEIQASYARTGNLFAFEGFGIIPDILLLGKSFGGGMPLSAVISSKEIMLCISENPVLGHITTFGGHPISCAAGLAVLDIITQEKLWVGVDEETAIFKQQIIHPEIVEFRSCGLWIAIELSSEEKLQRLIKKCLERGLIVDWFLFNAKSMRIAPPLNISNEEIIASCAIIMESLNDI
jgi:acetylornithine/succinyldiaminopimelate/putrescine aminotransferase